ncbi:MAG: 3-methyladenine DNA glycosylase, partial [Phototrophicales bacterium]
MILDREFYSAHATEVARRLLGTTLVHLVDGQRVSGKIVETEAYSGLNDLASHGRAGKTPRNLPMWE